MGTTYSVTIASESIDSIYIHSNIDLILNDINQQMSTYIDTSTISMFNALETGDSIYIGADFMFVLNQSVYFNGITSGAFDPTIKPLVELWGFGANGSIISIPNDKDISLAINQLGIDKISIKDNSVIKINDVNIDFSAIAKGYAVDKISDFLSNEYLPNHMVEIGGEVRVSGLKENHKPWIIGVQNPGIKENSTFLALSLSNKGMATSGNYRNYFDLDGRRYSHIISPISGYPVDNKILSVTVISDSCMGSDALATALMVMNIEEGIRLIESMPEFEAFYYLEDDEYLYSNGFKNFIH